jgi:putative transposase
VSDSNVIKLAQPGAFTDSLTEILRGGARALLTQAVEAEVAGFLAKHADLKTGTGRQRVVRHGHLPEREIMTGIGPVAVRQPRVRDREAGEGERIRYSSSILPRYARRSKSLEVLIPVLYLKGISSGDFEEALAALVGKDAPGLSASTIARLKEAWSEEHGRWQKRDLSAKRYVYWWADGIHLEARLEEQAQCILVIIGATAEGKKELVGFTDGMRESSQSWRDLLLDLKRRGLTTAAQIAVAKPALAKALGHAHIWCDILTHSPIGRYPPGQLRVYQSTHWALGDVRWRWRWVGLGIVAWKKGAALLEGMVHAGSTCLRRVADGKRRSEVRFNRFLANPKSLPSRRRG